MNNEISNQQALEKIEKAKVRTLIDAPFFAQLLCYLEIVEDEECATMGTDGERLIYGPEFVMGLNQKELNYVCIHEVLHIALGHIWRKGTRNPQIWNYACDYAVNDMIEQTIETDTDLGRCVQTPKNLLIDRKYRDMSAEQIYDILIKEVKDAIKKAKAKRGKGQGQGQGQGGGQGQGQGQGQGISSQDLEDVLGDLLDDHGSWDNPQTQQDKDAKQSDWNSRVFQSAESQGQGSGKVPGGISRMIDKLKKSTKNWREEIADFCQPDVNDYSFCPPDRRYSDSDFFLPDFNEKEDVARDVLIVMDTSGSISKKDLTNFYSETYGAINQFGDKLTGWVMFFDSMPYEPVAFTSAEELVKITPKGNGGTDFDRVLNKIAEYQEKGDYNFSGVIFCTDGYDTFPTKNPIEDIPLLWLMTNKQVVPPYGRYTVLDS